MGVTRASAALQADFVPHSFLTPLSSLFNQTYI